MKVTKPFCIDDDLTKDLKEFNASELVNSLLREYFDGINNMSLSKLKQLLSKKRKEKAALLKEIREITRKIDEITRKEIKILRLSKKYPKEMLEKLSKLQSLQALWVWRKTPPLNNYTYTELKDIFQEVKGGKLKK